MKIVNIKYTLSIICLLLQASLSYAQLSPGELSNAHAHLEGLTNCTQCHVLGEKETTSKCLECHTEIKQLIDLGKGYHASADVKGNKCAQCHGEHFGLNFNITRFDKDKFDHALSGYELQGKHAEIKCADCHKKDLILKNISQKKKGETYLGLGTECLSCHEDYHQNTLSGDCLSCHDQNAFRPATGFDHGRTNYPLIGKHATVDCEQCHSIGTRDGREFQKFSGLAFTNCTNCHTDVHNSKFGNDCRKCHNEFSFTEVKGMDAFNHDITDYPLKGMHQNVDCKKCHKGSLTQALVYNRCSNCHTDYHQRQFARQGVSPDCASCHSVDGFDPSSYTIEQHVRSEFPLEGAHLATPCFACHKTDAGWNFAFGNNECTQCHNNFHEDVLSDKYLPNNDCKSCHSVSSWNEITFNHNQTDYQLQGKHQEVSCRSCHFSEGENGLKQQFAAIDPSCVNCHSDVHFKQFDENGVTDCQRCHVFSAWNPEKFDHNKTRFALEDKHATLACVKCHEPTDGLLQNYIVYKFNDISCSRCH